MEAQSSMKSTPDQSSLILSLASLPESLRKQAIKKFTNAEIESLLNDWRTYARPEQLPPEGDWYIWLILSGRGWGKTRTGAEQVRAWAKDYPMVNLIGATADDARDIMIEGESGILAICPDNERPLYKKSERKLLWPGGSVSLIFTADEPERLRGKQHMKLWADELASWRYAQEAWDQAMLGLRLGDKPQAIVTTTPKPIKIIKSIIADSNVHITKGTTYDNRVNLASDFYRKVIGKYEGTRLGRQELNAEILDDNPNALWQRGRIDELRVREHPPLMRVVVGVDPAVSDTETSAETGIIVAGIVDIDGITHGFILDDPSIKGSPNEWASAAVTGYYKQHADRIIAEVNNGGDMVESTIKTVDPNVPVKKVHASRGKYVRAEPVSALYEQGRVHHVGFFPELEDQMCEWEPGDKSPDRLDALVWALTELMLGEYYAELHEDPIPSKRRNWKERPTEQDIDPGELVTSGLRDRSF